MHEQISHYPNLDGGQEELAAKFFLRGFADKTKWALIATVFFFFALIIRRRSE